MSTILEDGKGKGNKAQIDEDNRLHTRAVVVGEDLAANLEGQSFVAGTGIQTVNNDTDNYLLYIKNNSTMDMVLSLTLLTVGASTGGSNDSVTLLGQLNPTAGTILSSGISFSPFNLNLSSQNVFDGDALVGTSMGLTASGGQQANALVLESSRVPIETILILPRGSSLAGGFKAPSGNTSMDVNLTYTVYFRNPEIV